MHAGKVDNLQQLLARAQLEADAAAGEASSLRGRVKGLQQEVAAKAAAARAATASAQQAQQVRAGCWLAPAWVRCMCGVCAMYGAVGPAPLRQIWAGSIIGTSDKHQGLRLRFWDSEEVPAS